MTRFFISFSHGFSLQAYVESAIMYTIITSRFITTLHTKNFLFEPSDECIRYKIRSGFFLWSSSFFGAVKILRFLNFEGCLW